jgi:DNA (cytosine-5)-methyltransferase 1
LQDFPATKAALKSVLETAPSENLKIDTALTKKLLATFTSSELAGKQIKDKRGGTNNIHSWDLEVKGKLSNRQKQLMQDLLRQRRRKSWAESKGIPWSDGMPLSLEEIYTFADVLYGNSIDLLKRDLEDLLAKGYLAFEYPKKGKSHPGYNIVVGKLSFDVSHILNPNDATPTLVATDVTRLAVVDKKLGLRRLSIREGLRLFGFPDTYQIPQTIPYTKAFDLLGNSVTLNVVTLVCGRLLEKL